MFICEIRGKGFDVNAHPHKEDCPHVTVAHNRTTHTQIWTMAWPIIVANTLTLVLASIILATKVRIEQRSALQQKDPHG